MNPERRDTRRSIADAIDTEDPPCLDDMNTVGRRESDRLAYLFAHLLKVDNRLSSHLIDHRALVEETLADWFRSPQYEEIEKANRDKLKVAVMAGIGECLWSNLGQVILFAVSIIGGCLAALGWVLLQFAKHAGWVNLP